MRISKEMVGGVALGVAALYVGRYAVDPLFFRDHKLANTGLSGAAADLIRFYSEERKPLLQLQSGTAKISYEDGQIKVIPSPIVMSIVNSTGDHYIAGEVVKKQGHSSVNAYSNHEMGVRKVSFFKGKKQLTGPQAQELASETVLNLK